MTGERRDPYKNFRFRIEVNGITQGGFSEVSGFDLSIDVIEYREGTDIPTPRKLSGLAKYGNITLKRGSTDSMELYTWMVSGVKGKVQRQTLSIMAVDEEGTDVATWVVKEAWPTKYSAPDFNAMSAEVAIESLEIAHEGMERTR